ncbi:glycosyltransferase family 4 protein [Cellulomonas cellasea]|uniref:glycosyltransferase family 4 protein n=1 Tax=Cellulomonas cellasea TaxID=43670 RepID=UPI0025A32946|nr:glycosyltransferase family 4 protein [Cellulomonas cellasea]MDM8083260.1 glycosyltransferase family 4 protein [Cellulomonas cellasea]
MSPVDVAHVVCTEAFAGVERYVATLAREQDARGMRVQVLGGAPERMRAELAGGGVGWSPAATPWHAVRGLMALRGLRLVHAHMTAAESAAVVGARAPIVVTRHFAGRRGSTPPARLAGRVVARRVADQVAISSFVAQRIEGPSTVIHPGVRPQPAGAGGSREPVVLVAQRLEAEKRTDLALRMWAASGLAAHGWRLQVAGEGALLGELRRLAVELGVAGSCDFLGARADIADLMARAGVFLAPRPDEPYGLSVVEAMAHGLPVVAAAGGGHDETVGASPLATLVDAAEPDGAGAALAALAGDPGRRAAYGEDLRRLQRRQFTVAAHAARLEAVYRAAVLR